MRNLRSTPLRAWALQQDDREGPNPSGLCQCGCGGKTPLAKQTVATKGHVLRKPVRFIAGHGRRGRGSGKAERVRHGDGYRMILAPDHPRANPLGYVLEHLLVAERALGRAVPLSSPVHHVDRDRANNAPTNLVICEDTGYHALLHRRLRALHACGNANFVKCGFCREYDALDVLSSSTLRTGPRAGTVFYYHAKCNRERSRARNRAIWRAA